MSLPGIPTFTMFLQHEHTKYLKKHNILLQGLRIWFSAFCLALIATILKKCSVPCEQMWSDSRKKSHKIPRNETRIQKRAAWPTLKKTWNSHPSNSELPMKKRSLRRYDNLWSFAPTFQSQTHPSVDQLWHEPSLQTHLWQHSMSGWVASFQSLRHNSDNIYSYSFTRMKCAGDLMESNAIELLCKKPSVTATCAHVWIGTIVVGSFAERTSLAAALSDMKFKSRPLRRCESVWQVLQTSSSFLLLHADNHRPHVLINYTISHFRFDFSSGSVRKDRKYMWK